MHIFKKSLPFYKVEEMEGLSNAAGMGELPRGVPMVGGGRGRGFCLLPGPVQHLSTSAGTRCSILQASASWWSLQGWTGSAWLWDLCSRSSPARF